MLAKLTTAEPNPGSIVGTRTRDIDTELLDDVALHFGNRDLQHDLVAAMDGDAVDDLVAVVNQPRGNIEGLLRFDRRRDIARQHDAVAQSLDVNIKPGKRLFHGCRAGR